MDDLIGEIFKGFFRAIGYILAQGESMNAHYFAIATPTPASNTISK